MTSEIRDNKMKGMRLNDRYTHAVKYASTLRGRDIHESLHPVSLSLGLVQGILVARAEELGVPVTTNSTIRKVAAILGNHRGYSMNTASAHLPTKTIL